MNLHDIAKFTLSGSASGQVKPATGELKFDLEFDEEVCADRIKLQGQLTFAKEDFKTLWEVENGPENCPDVRMLLELCCEDEFFDAWEGRLNFNDVDFDCDSCIVRMGINTADEFDCITQNWETKLNLLDVPDKVEIDSLIGEVECQTTFSQFVFNEIPPQAPIPPGAGWTMQIKTIQIKVNSINPDVQTRCIIQWCRECLTTTPPSGGAGWTQEGSNWYRALNVGNPVVTVLPPDIQGDPVGDFDVVSGEVTTYEIVDIEIDNGVTLGDALQFLLPDCEICSDFLGINSDGTAPDNIAYQYAQNFLQNIIIAQPSDIIFANADNNATIFNISFKKIWDTIKKAWNLKMVNDKDRDCIRIEHVSYKKNRHLLDIRKEPLKKYANNKNGFTRNDDDYPREETWSAGPGTGNIKHDSAEVIYDGCIDGEVECEIECYGTDINSMYNNPNFQGSDFEEDGIIFIALDANGQILNNNDPLGIRCIVENLHIWDRVYLTGEMNGQIFNFLSVRKLRKHKPLKHPLKCEDFFKSFCEQGVVYKTKFGIAEVDKLTYCLPSKQLEVNLDV